MVDGVERATLAQQGLGVDALGQAFEVSLRDPARCEVWSPAVNNLDDPHDLGGRLRGRVAEEFALRHRVGQSRFPQSRSDDEFLMSLS